MRPVCAKSPLKLSVATRFDLIFCNLVIYVLLLPAWNCKPDGKGKAIPVTGRRGPQGCETSRLPHLVDNRLTDCGEVVSLTRRPAALYPWYSFLLEAESTLGP
jgi:hypothetical protein